MVFLSRVLAWAENAVLAAGTALAATLIVLQVILRYGFAKGIPWAEELSVYAIVWTAFIAASAGLRTGGHLAVEIRALLLSGRGLAVLARVENGLGMLFAIALGVYGWELVESARRFGQLSPSLQAPMWVVYLILPIAGCMLAFRFLERLLRVRHSGQ